ncbi:MAG: S41 family peptidase [Porphyromonas sp.]|nr:S41 family peptidase [Porphyromonas sp.]
MRQYYTLALLMILGLLGCVPQEPKNSDYMTNFEALWKIIDERYCFLEEKGVDWDKVHRIYAQKVKNEARDDLTFFHLMTEMLRELKDGHVNLISSFDNGRYTEIVDDATTGLNIYARDMVLGRPEYWLSGGMRYVRLKVINTDISFGYISYGSFSSSLGDMKFILSLFKDCDAIILDVRGNGGGRVDNATKLVSYFLTEKTLVGYSSHKLSPRRGHFSELKPLYISPNESITWTEKPLIILQDRGSYSATNDFLYKVATAKNVVRIGQRSGGGAGLPSSSELPNGWRVRYSAVKNYDANKKPVEEGIDPDIYMENDSYYDNPDAVDNILLRAIKYVTDLKKNP